MASKRAKIVCNACAREGRDEKRVYSLYTLFGCYVKMLHLCTTRLSYRKELWARQQADGDMRFAHALLLLLLGSLVDEVHKLVELRGDDNLGATIALLAHSCIVRSHRIVLTTTSS